MRMPRSGVIVEVRPAGVRVHRAVLVGGGLERAHDGRADGDHLAAGGAGRVDARGGVRGDLVALRVGALAALLRADAGVQDDPLDGDPALAQGGERAPGERAAGARHLRAAGGGGEDRLVVFERARLGLVGVADRRAVRVEVGVQVLGEVEPGDPQAPGREVGREQLRSAAAGQRQRLGGRVADAAAVAAQFDDPPRVRGGPIGCGTARGAVPDRRARRGPRDRGSRGAGRRRCRPRGSPAARRGASPRR